MSQHILVVEDEAAIADNLTYALETEGFQVSWCSTLQEAKDLAQHISFSLLVLDVGLPDGNGFDFYRELRRESYIPVIFLTARSSEIDRVVGLELGADDYVVKPFSPRELCARVRAVLRRSSDSTSPSATSPCFQIDPSRHQIEYQGHPLELSRYEYRLLELLATHPGRVFTREQLMDQVWEEPDASLDRTVDTHIKTLRSKMRDIVPDRDPIQTHRGVGYSMRDDK